MSTLMTAMSKTARDAKPILAIYDELSQCLECDYAMTRFRFDGTVKNILLVGDMNQVKSTNIVLLMDFLRLVTRYLINNG